MSIEVRDGRVRAQYLSARAKLEPSERATQVGQVSPAVLLPADPGSFLLAGTMGAETDWGGAYRVAALTTGMLFGGDGQLTRPLEVGLQFGPMVRERAAMSIAVAVQTRGLPPAEGTGRG